MTPYPEGFKPAPHANKGSPGPVSGYMLDADTERAVPHYAHSSGAAAPPTPTAPLEQIIQDLQDLCCALDDGIDALTALNVRLFGSVPTFDRAPPENQQSQDGKPGQLQTIARERARLVHRAQALRLLIVRLTSEI